MASRWEIVIGVEEDIDVDVEKETQAGPEGVAVLIICQMRQQRPRDLYSVLSILYQPFHKIDDITISY